MNADAETDRVRTHWEECWRERSHHACAVARIEKLEAERERLREALGWTANQVWEYTLDGGTFQDEMIERGLMVEVPASERFREEWDADTMYVMAWWPAARTALEEGGRDE